MSILIQSENLLTDFLVGIILAVIISSISYRFKLLTFSGSLATFFLAAIIYGFGTWQWTTPVVTFFLFSSLLSKYRKRKNEIVETYFEKSGERDHFQVLANGGLACLLVTINYFYPSELVYVVYLSCIAAVCSDTWATEIGTIFKAKTINIISFKKVQQGISGGISLPGLIGSLAGALVIAATSLPWLESNYLVTLMIIVSAGFIGNIVDSILGATVQVQYICKVCYNITERKVHCNSGTKPIRGINWINNDAVNFGASFSGGLFSIILYDFVKG